jgi:hypothetical protein
MLRLLCAAATMVADPLTADARRPPIVIIPGFASSQLHAYQRCTCTGPLGDGNQALPAVVQPDVTVTKRAL